MTSRPRSSSRQNVVRSGRVKVASNNVEVLQVEASELPSLRDLDPHPASDAPTTSTPSIVKSPFRQASPSLTHEFVDPACKTCANFTSAVNRVHIAGDHVVGQVFSVVSAEAAPASQGFVLVDMFVDLPSTSQVNASGKVVDVSAKQPRLHYSVFLRRVATHWLVRAVQDAK